MSSPSIRQFDRYALHLKHGAWKPRLVLTRLGFGKFLAVSERERRNMKTTSECCPMTRLELKRSGKVDYCAEEVTSSGTTKSVTRGVREFGNSFEVG